MDKLSEIYYQPDHLWIKQKAVKKLKELTDLKPKEIKSWLSKQAFWQTHLPAPKQIDRPHYEITKPNQMHQFDLLYMPGDVVYGSKYKYILSGVDVASRYKIARPLRTKKASDVEFLLKTIYENDKIPLTYPKTFQVDNGSEFKGEVTKLLEKHGVEINRTTTKYKHMHTAFAESFNKILGENLFKIQDAQELNDPEIVATTWVKHLYNLVDRLNDTKTEMTGMKPNVAIKLDEVKLTKQENYPSEELLPEDGLYRYFLQSGEEHGDQRKRATDRIWSKKTYRLREVISESGNRVMYYLKDGPDRAFVKEELMQIPENTELPPDYVQNW